MTTFEETITTANVLANSKKYSEAIEHYKIALDNTTIAEHKLDINNTIGRLYLGLQNNDKAIKTFEKSLEIHNALDEDKAEFLKVNKATIYNNLGVIVLQENPKQAVKYHKEAIAIFTKKHDIEAEKYALHLANSYYSSGDANYKKKNLYAASKHFREAIKLYKNIENTPSTIPFMANAYYNMGNINTDEDNIHNARTNYLNALKLFTKLTEEQPEAYRSLLAATLNNLAVTAKTMYKYSDAVSYYKKSLEHYSILKEQDSNTFLPFYASTLNSVGIIYTEMHEIKDDYDSEGLSGYSGFGSLSADNVVDKDKLKLDIERKENARKYYTEALKIYEDLAAKEPEIYTHYVATCRHNLGVLYDEKGDEENAKSYYFSALEIRRFLAKEQAKEFNLDVCVTLLNIVTMYQNLFERNIEISYKVKALDLLKEVEDNLKIYTEETPILLSMKSDTQYFTQFFKSVDEEYLDILETFDKADILSEKINETIVPLKKFVLHIEIIKLLENKSEQFPNNEKLKQEMLDAYIHHSWISLRSNELIAAQKAIENSFNIDENNLVTKANEAHLYLVRGENKRALDIYNAIKDLKDAENESFKIVLEQDLKVLKNDGILKQDVSEIISKIIA